MSDKVAEAAQSGAITNLRLPGLQLLESANWLVTKLQTATHQAPIPARALAWSRFGKRRCLTPRSRRGPTSKRQARAAAQAIFRSAGLAFCCRSRLSSNVRQHKNPASIKSHASDTRHVNTPLHSSTAQSRGMSEVKASRNRLGRTSERGYKP